MIGKRNLRFKKTFKFVEVMVGKRFGTPVKFGLFLMGVLEMISTYKLLDKSNMK